MFLIKKIMKNFLFVVIILVLSNQALLLRTISRNLLKQVDPETDGVHIGESPIIDPSAEEARYFEFQVEENYTPQGGDEFGSEDQSEYITYTPNEAGFDSTANSQTTSEANSDQSSDFQTSSYNSADESSAYYSENQSQAYNSDFSESSSNELYQSSETSDNIVEECHLDLNTEIPSKERTIEYIEVDVPDTENPNPKICKKKRPEPPQPEQIIYGPFYSQDIVTENEHHLRDTHEGVLATGTYEERVEKSFEEALERKEDENLSKLVAKQNETIEKTKKAKKKQKQLKKIIEVEYRKGKKKNTKYIDELKHELDKSIDRVEELETEAVLAQEIIKQAVEEAHKEELRKEQADEFEKVVEHHLDEERSEEDKALERLVEINKAKMEYEKRLDEIKKEECSSVERRSELYNLTHHIEEEKRVIIEELKVKLGNLNNEIDFERATKKRLCEIKKELISDKQNVENIQEEIKKSEQRNTERTEESAHSQSRTSSEKSEIQSEKQRIEESSEMKKSVEQRLAELNQRKSLIESLLFKETETIKKEVKKKKSGKRVLDELMEKKNKVLDYLKDEHVTVEEEHSAEEESHDVISELLHKLEHGEFRSLDKSYESKQEDSVHAKLDETAKIEASDSLTKSAEFQELKSHVSEEKLEHKLEEMEREEKYEETKEEAIQVAVGQVVAEAIEHEIDDKCDAIKDAIHQEAEIFAENISIPTTQAA
jgi:hypothetical protein